MSIRPSGDRFVDIFRYSFKYIHASSVRIVASVKRMYANHPLFCNRIRNQHDVFRVVDLLISTLISGPYHVCATPRRSEHNNIINDHVL